LAAELRQVFPNAQIQLMESSGGVFEVRVGDELVFSKQAVGRHAEPGEVLGLVKRYVSSKR